MDVLLVCMGGNNESLITMRESFCKLIAKSVRLFGRDLTRAKGLTKMISNYVIFTSIPSRSFKIFSLCKKKLGVCGVRIAGISGDQFSLFCFTGIDRICDYFANGCAG